MDRKLKTLKNTLCTLVIIFLISCGGNSNKSNEQEPVAEVEIKTGLLFIDELVSGVEYRAASISGITDSEGTFQYSEGEEITFHLGDIELGVALGNDVITLLDLAGSLDNLEQRYLPADRSLNILRFLQTIGFWRSSPTDESKEYLIILPQQLIAAQGQMINFDQSIQDFETDPLVIGGIQQLTEVISEDLIANELISQLDSQARFSVSLGQFIGIEVDWTTYLGVQHGKISTYEREIKAGSSSEMDIVSTYYKSTVYHNYSPYLDFPIWVQGWSDNWKAGQFVYLDRDFSTGVYVRGSCSGNGVEKHFVNKVQVLSKYLIPGYWLIFKEVEDDNIIESRVMAVFEESINLNGTEYFDILKITRSHTSSGVTVESWYARDIGLIKKFSTTIDIEEEILLQTTEVVEDLPFDPVTNRAQYIEILKEYIELELFPYREAMIDELNEINALAHLLGHKGSEEHRDSFRSDYQIRAADYAIRLAEEIISISSQYPLDKTGVSKLLDSEYLNTVFLLVFLTLLFELNSTEFTNEISLDIYNIFQAAGDLVVASGVIEEFDFSLLVY